MYVCIQLQSVDLWKSHTIYGRKWMPPSVPYSEVSLYIYLLKKPQVFHVVLSVQLCVSRPANEVRHLNYQSLVVRRHSKLHFSTLHFPAPNSYHECWVVCLFYPVDGWGQTNTELHIHLTQLTSGWSNH